MKKAISLLLAMMLLVLFTSAALSESQGTVMYVCTKNGKVLLVRSSMSAADNTNVIGTLEYGAKIITYGVQDGWAVIDYGNRAAYVMNRYLVRTKPAPFDPSGSSEKVTQSTKSATTVAQLNTLVASAKAVTPYTVTVRPTRASGWVYMRWFPSSTSEKMATYAANYQLTVIAELKDWYQVSDEATGMVGFVYKSYIQ